MTSEYRDFYDDEKEHLKKLAEDETLAGQDPTLDFYSIHKPNQPKYSIGKYVRSEGIPVPLADDQDTWESAFDNDRAMLRSEMVQDYSGFSGLLSSLHIRRDRLQYALEHIEDRSSNDFRQTLGSLLVSGLRSRELSGGDYMRHFEWVKTQEYIDHMANTLGVPSPLSYRYPTASHWEYIDGTNIRVYKDPIVDGRYHVGTIPPDGYVSGWRFDTPDHERQIQNQPYDDPVPVKGIIEIYEEIRKLSRFDTSQCPVLELVYDKKGRFHFLQYLKTNQVEAPLDPFQLPEGNKIVTANNVRGATREDGTNIRLYISPRRITSRMIGQGFFFDLSHPGYFEQQCMSLVGSVIVHGVYVSFKDNHFNSAPLYRPEVAMGLTGSQGIENAKGLRDLVRIAQPWAYDKSTKRRHVYVDAHVTANGRQATIESNWEPKFEPDDSVQFESYR